MEGELWGDYWKHPHSPRWGNEKGTHGILVSHVPLIWPLVKKEDICFMPSRGATPGLGGEAIWGTVSYFYT